MGKLWEWFVDPLVKIMEGSSEEPELRILPPVTTTTEAFKKPYRPLSFDAYIGQERAKTLLKAYIQGIRDHNKIFPHILLHGNAGCGKTTLVRILAKELGVNITECIASEIYEDYFRSIIPKILENPKGIVFIDEIHGLPRGVAETMYPIMEDFKSNMGAGIMQVNLPLFTLAGATTELGEIIKTRRPFFDRFKILIELENYKPEELTKIAKQYKENTFPSTVIREEDIVEIGKNSRGVPRMAIKLLEANIYLHGDIKTVFYNFGIIKDGYTEKDLKVLEYLKDNEKGVGLEGLSCYLNTSTDNYLHQVEPYLVQTGLIARTPRGRKITEKGIAKIGELR